MGSFKWRAPIAMRDVAVWEHDLHHAMDNIQDEIDMVGVEGASMDAYAASNPAECFAVLSEYFFSAPELLEGRFRQSINILPVLPSRSISSTKTLGKLAGRQSASREYSLAPLAISLFSTPKNMR